MGDWLVSAIVACEPVAVAQLAGMVNLNVDCSQARVVVLEIGPELTSTVPELTCFTWRDHAMGADPFALTT